MRLALLAGLLAAAAFSTVHAAVDLSKDCPSNMLQVRARRGGRPAAASACAQCGAAQCRCPLHAASARVLGTHQRPAPARRVRLAPSGRCTASARRRRSRRGVPIARQPRAATRPLSRSPVRGSRPLSRAASALACRRAPADCSDRYLDTLTTRVINVLQIKHLSYITEPRV